MNAAGYLLWVLVIVGAAVVVRWLLARRRTGPRLSTVECVLAVGSSLLAAADVVIVPVFAEPGEQPGLTHYVMWSMMLSLMLAHRVHSPRSPLPPGTGAGESQPSGSQRRG